LQHLSCEKSFSKAAKLLYVSPTALIKQIEQLEEGIGTTLLAQHGDALLADVRAAADSRDSTSALRTSFPGDTSSSCGISYKNDWQRQHPAYDRFLMSTTVGAPIKS